MYITCVSVLYAQYTCAYNTFTFLDIESSVQLYLIILDESSLSNCATAVTYTNIKLSHYHKKP